MLLFNISKLFKVFNMTVKPVKGLTSFWNNHLFLQHNISSFKKESRIMRVH